jgi:hypothetical protein
MQGTGRDSTPERLLCHVDMRFDYRDIGDDNTPASRYPHRPKHMRRLSTILHTLLLAGSLGTVHAGESWLLLPQQNGGDTVAVPLGSALRTVATPGSIASYGQTDRVLGLLSYQPLLARHVLTIIDKASQEVTASVLIDMDENVHPVRWLSGAVLNLVLTEQFAYFVSYTWRDGDSEPHRNSNGGFFDFDRVTLVSGKLEQFPLPAECVNCRLVDFEGTPLIYAWEGSGVWKFDAKRSLVTLVSARDVKDILDREGDAKYGGRRKVAAADYVMVPGAGVFRLSRLGELQQVLNADLTPVGLPRRTVKVAGAGQNPEILLGRFHGSPAIGVVRNVSDHLEFEYVDPATFKFEWQAILPRSVIIPSLYGLSDDAVVYLDQATSSIDKTTPEGTTVMQKLSANAAQFGFRILSIDSPQR